jgi:superoxide dismutase, Cu-Zn family
MRTHLTIAAALLTLGCGAREDEGANDTTSADSPATAVTPGTSTDPGVSTTIRDANGRDLGSLTLTDAAGGISVSGRLTGLPPGDHGMHLHMVGRCDAPDFASAGGHWNPTNRQHGSQNPNGPHLGDMPNVSVGQDSTATVQGVTAGGTLRATDMLLDTDGAALIIHRSRDDLQTDPSGRSEDPIACGTIGSQSR